MNETVAKWIIEFLLRQTIDEKIINGVLSCLPLSDNDNRLKKTILLRSIDLEASNGLVREKLLEYLEIIEELDHREGRKASNLMRGAYCAVAVDCTVRFLDDKMEDNAKYVETVERVWKSRVCKVKGLASEGLERWLGAIEEASKDSSVCAKICARNTRNEALRAVKGYVNEAWKCMGPPFLEVMAAKAGDVVQVMCVGAAVGPDLGATEGIQDGQASVGRKHVSGKTRSIRPTRVIRRPRSAKISDPDDEAPEEPMNVANDDPTSIMEKVQETHKFDSLQLHTRVNESHPDASQAAHNLPFIKAKDGTNNRDAAKSMAVLVINVTPEVDASKSSTGELDAAATDPRPDARNLSSTKAKESRSNVDAAKNKTAQGIHATSEVNRVREATESSSRELHVAVTDPFPEGPNLSFTKATDSTSNMDAAKKKTVPARHATPEVNRVQEALRTSCRELREAVTDPLPEALKVAAALSRKRVTGNHETAVGNQAEEEFHARPRVDSMQPASEPPRSVKVDAAVQNSSSDASRPFQNVSSKMATYDMGNDLALANPTQDVPRDSTDKNIEDIDKADEHNGNIQENGTHEQRTEQLKRKRSLMEPNGTGQTYEWDDSIANSSTGSPERPRLRSHSARTRPSQLRAYAKANTKKWNRWTPREVEALKDGVKRFGHKWADIVEHDSIFWGRLPRDLKDKWQYIAKRCN